MRSFLIVALLATTLCFTTEARKLTQDALSNSNGCLPTIPMCEQGACATRNIMGVAKWVCLRCLGGYETVIDASGQDNIIQCVCPKGTFETASGCTRCPSNQFCPGGDKVENPTTRGTNTTCGDNLVTRNTGARSQSDCLAPAGYARTSPTAATPCGTSEYAPLYNRLSKCLKCQSGLLENPDIGLTASQRDSKRAVCKLPPGRYMSQGLVRVCPQGFFRENYVDFDAAIGTVCKACNPGVTTAGAGSGLRTDCNVVLPGYGIAEVNNATSAADVPALPSSNSTDSGLPPASLCELGFYSLGGYCARCPSLTVTTAKGAKSIEECVVPPGYFVPAGANLTKCANSTSGSFREGWVMHNDPKGASCTPCGEGIYSEARELDENPMANNGSMVMATSASCYIEAGFGMIAQGNNLFVGKACPVNTYGAAGKVYGWAAAPCKPCPRNMITDGATKVTSMDICVNDNGFGYASEGASRCAPGFYSNKGSKKPCQQCPAGRTTADLQDSQRFVTDCYVRSGFGVVNSTANSTDAFNPDTSALTPEQKAAMPVLECPIGYFSTAANGATDLKCTACPAGSSTTAPGSTNATSCSVCSAGFGIKAGETLCTLCPYGTFQPGTGTTCQECPKSKFYTPVDGLGTTYESSGTTTYPGAFGEESCVPKYSQLSPEAGQAYLAPTAVSPLLANSSAADLAACIASCDATKLCLAQYDVAKGQCWKVALPPAASDAASGTHLVYKLPPSTLGSASSVTPEEGQVGAKMMSSGYYAHGDISAAAAAWGDAGSHLDATARTFSTGKAPTTGTTLKDCKKMCDNSNLCWGFVWVAGSNSCNFRGGVDALATRAFFGLPTDAQVQLKNYKW